MFFHGDTGNTGTAALLPVVFFLVTDINLNTKIPSLKIQRIFGGSTGVKTPLCCDIKWRSFSMNFGVGEYTCKSV